MPIFAKWQRTNGQIHRSIIGHTQKVILGWLVNVGHAILPQMYHNMHYWLTLVLLYPDIPCLCKQCRSRSVGFWRSQLIWICTVCHYVCMISSVSHYVCVFIATIWIKQSDWLKIRSGRGILIYSTGQGLISTDTGVSICDGLFLFFLFSSMVVLWNSHIWQQLKRIWSVWSVIAQSTLLRSCPAGQFIQPHFSWQALWILLGFNDT